MNKYATVREFEKQQIQELENFKDAEHRSLVELESTHKQKMQNISQELMSYKDELDKKYQVQLEQEVQAIKKSSHDILQQLDKHLPFIDDYAQDVAEHISSEKHV